MMMYHSGDPLKRVISSSLIIIIAPSESPCRGRTAAEKQLIPTEIPVFYIK